jgi:hypothetical protein
MKKKKNSYLYILITEEKNVRPSNKVSIDVTFDNNHGRINIPETTISAVENRVQPAISPHTLADQEVNHVQLQHCNHQRPGLSKP